MILALLLSMQSVAGLPQVSLQSSGDHHAVEVAEFDQSLASAVESEVARRAGEICSGRSVEWGKFRFDQNLGKDPGAEPVKVTAYRREFRCTDASQTSFGPAPADWKARPSDEADVRRFFESYYDRRDAGDMKGALTMFRPGMPDDPDSWATGIREFNKQLGEGRRRVSAVAWYVNPEAADRPGIYAAIDFVGNYPAAHFYCGYTGLYRKGPASYEIVREEQNQFTKGSEPPDPQQLAQMRASLCRGD